MINFSDNLKQLRKERNLTQNDIAKILNISRQAYSKYEKGLSEPSLNSLVKLANYFDISTDTLLGRKLYK